MVRRILLTVSTTMIWMITVSNAAAQEKQSPETLPEPRSVIETEQPIIIQPPPFVDPRLRPQMGTRDVWQLYGVSNKGMFRPRVIYSPYGSYYLYNGRPYPWTTTRPTWYRGLMAR